MTLLLSFLIVLSQMAAALPNQGVNDDAYNLHQALNYLNVYSSGKCDKALDLAKKHLSKIKEKSSEKPIGEIVVAVRKYKKPSPKDIFDLESLRMKFGEAMEANHIEHKMVWHREIRTICPTAPRVE